MSTTEQANQQASGWSARRLRFLNRLQARLAVRVRPATGFVSQPEPRTIGSFARGRQLIAGNFLFAGHLIEEKGRSIWDIGSTSPGFAEVCHGFGWLDDLAAVSGGPARRLAQGWTFDWIARCGRGQGPGWTPDLTGRRLIRWISQALFLLNGRDKASSEAFFRLLAQQTIFLSKRWHATTPGLPRFEALTGLLYAGLSLTGMERHVTPATEALARECAAQIGAEGGLASRNPEELLEVFTLLTWAALALREAGRAPMPAHAEAIERIAPTLRALRHADGGLARFHGGGRGVEGRLDQALATSGVRARPLHGRAMGYARLSAGRSTVIVDAASPPTGASSLNGHASTLGFELTSGRRPMVVNCGSGMVFGPEWGRAGRATPSHSTLGIAGYSSSRMGGEGLMHGVSGDQLTDVPDLVRFQQAATQDGALLIVGHNGYVRTHGMTHVRQLELSFDGRVLVGEDTLGAMSGHDRAHFERVLDKAGTQGVAFDIRFHLHPDVDASLDLGGTAVSLVLKSREVWVFRHDGNAKMALSPSVYLEKGRLKPRATKQIVLHGRVMDYAAQIGWTLAKAQDNPQSIRDLEREELPSFDDPLFQN